MEWQGAGFLEREGFVVTKLAVMGIGMPGWHPAAQDYFANHGGLALDDFMARHRKRTDVALAVTTGALGGK